MFANVLGRILAFFNVVSLQFTKNPILVTWLTLIVLVLAGVLAFVLVVVELHMVRCLLYFVTIFMNGFLYCVANQTALHKLKDQPHWKPKLMRAE